MGLIAEPLPARFADALAKYAHAQRHLASLGACLSAYEDSRPWRPEKTDDLPEGMVRIRLLSPPPGELSLILGDVVHNLRASLDYATCALVEFGNPLADLRRTQFPFGSVGHPLKSDDKKGLPGIAPHALHAIEEARRQGGDYLGLLRDLSNQDKHRLLVTTTLRRYPMRVAIDTATNTADFVPDFDGEPETWFRPLADGDVIEMPKLLHLKVGLVIDGAAAPYAIPAVDQVNRAVAGALDWMRAAVTQVRQVDADPDAPASG